MNASELEAYLEDCRQLALREIGEFIPPNPRYRSVLYDLVMEYPLRASKGLRPGLCIATCRALGERVEFALRSAAVLELYHNAFLVHDDVEDGSETRRGRPTLQWSHGAPIAVNVGDAMLALALEPLLDNMRTLGLGKALRIMQVVARMARESTEGQAMELDWIRHRRWRLRDADYVRMVYKKTSWYTFIGPMVIGGIIADASSEHLAALRKFAALLGVAFQAQDDVLNLIGQREAYGKEIAGDLWEGKHTLIVLHMMRNATDADRRRARRILGKPRPTPPQSRPHPSGRNGHTPRAWKALLAELRNRGDLTETGRRALDKAVRAGVAFTSDGFKTPEDIGFLRRLIERHGSIEHGGEVARRFARKAQAILARADWLAPSVHRDFLEELVGFVVDRER